MELKPPKPKKKPTNIARLISWGKMFKTPLLILFLLGTTNCENDSDSDISDMSKSVIEKPLAIIDQIKLPKLNLEHFDNEKQFILSLNQSTIEFASEIYPDTKLSDFDSDSGSDVYKRKHLRHRHRRTQLDKGKLTAIRYLRRHLNKEIVNFVMSDVLMDGEIENRVHFNGITSKETYVGADGQGLRLRQLTDGRHLVQVIYNQNGVIQDCEYITQGKSARNFLKTLRKELKQALDEETLRITEKSNEKSNGGKTEDIEKFYRHFGNVTLRILKSGEALPTDVASWFNYDSLKRECIKRHEEMKYMMENNSKIGGVSLARFRACLKLADTSVSNMVGKLFFNVVQTKCFILKPVKMCTKRSWWGKCLRRGYMKQAHLRDNLPY